MSRNLSRRALFAAAGAGLLIARKGFSFATRNRRVAVQTGSATGTIRPELHSHFAEHLGSCTYGGLWVGRESKIPNINGYRKDAIEFLRALGIPVLRWPGGCFADDYHWRDGIGPPGGRPKRVNIWWGGYTEDNSFGTHEFLGLCKLIGAEPYLAGNVGSGTPAELRDWVEYCNYPSGSTLAEERARNGSPEPFRVKYWGVGNENWGCGGNLKPEEYAGLYRRYATYLRSFGDLNDRGRNAPFLIACGPNGNSADWTRGFFENMRGRMPDGYAMHFYSNGRLNATRFTVEAMREQLASFARIEKAVIEQRALMDRYDPQQRIGLLVDEWGVWDRMDPAEEKKYGRLWQQITMRSAVAAALGLNLFHRQAGKLVMCNIAQIVNVLHSVLLTDGSRTVRTSAYYAFELLKPHRGATAVKIEQDTDEPVGLSVSASKQGGQLVVTLVNASHDEAMAVDCAIEGARAAGSSARILTHPDFNACNTFEAPDTIVPRAHRVEAAGGRLKVELPPLSIVTATLTLA